MKKQYSLWSLIMLIALLAGACQKDNRKAKKLDGEWTVKSVKKDGKAVDVKSTLFAFTRCKVTKEDCSGSLKSEDNSMENFDWQIYSKGEMFALIYDDTKINQQGGELCFYEYDDFYWDLPCSVSEAELECLYYSGNYNIDTWDDDLLVISSTNCTGCYDKQLVITLEKKG